MQAKVGVHARMLCGNNKEQRIWWLEY